MLTSSNHLAVFRTYQYIFQEDVFYDLRRHRGEADWSVVPTIVLTTLLKKGWDIPLFQSVGTCYDFHDFSNVLERGLATH